MVKSEHFRETDIFGVFIQVCIVVDKSLYGQVVGIYFYFGAISKTCLNQAKYHGSP